MDNTTKCIVVSSVSTLLFLSLLLIGLSYNTVAYYQIGLTKSRSTGSVDRSSVYENGNYFLNPDNAFLVYPSTIMTKSFPNLSIWSLASKEDAGIFLEIDITFQYYIIPETLGKLYNKIGTNYDKLLESLAISAIKNEAVKWSSDDYLKNRRKIEKSMLKSLHSKLEDEANCNITSLQLLDIQFPQSFYDRKLDTAVQIQTNIATEYSLNAQIIRGKTSQMVAYLLNQATQTIKLSESQAINIKEIAKTKSKEIIQNAKIESFFSIVKELNITNKTQILSLDYLLQLELEKDNIDFFINFEDNLFSINK